MTTIRYRPPSFMHLAWIYATFSCIEDIHHLPELFIFKFKKLLTELQSMFLCLFWTFRSNKPNLQRRLHFKKKFDHHPLSWHVWQLNSIRTFTQALTYTSSGIHVIRNKIFQHQCMTLGRYDWWFISKNWLLQRHLKKHSEDFNYLFSMISTLSNNDVINGVSGYSKCLLLPCPMLKGIKIFRN